MSSNSVSTLEEIVPHVKKINSISTISSDINLDEIATNNRIIFLGELTHDDYVSDTLSLELIKTLHEKYNFNILIEEMGLRMGNVTERDTAEDVIKSLYKQNLIFLELGEYDILNYYQASRKSKNPLILAGIDLSYDSGVTTGLKQFVMHNINNSTPILESKELAFITSFYKKTLFSKPKHVKQNKRVERFVLYCKTLATQLQLSQSKDVAQQQYWIQELENMSSYVSWMWYHEKTKIHQDFDIRDEQMARNLLWYIHKVYPTEKIIVRVSNYHLARYLNTIENNARLRPNTKVCLDLAKDSIKDNYFSIAFTHYFTPTIGKEKPIDYIPIADETSLEAILHAHNYNYAFLNMKELKAKNINTTFNSYLLLRTSCKADWASVYDGIIYIDKEKINFNYELNVVPYPRRKT